MLAVAMLAPIAASLIQMAVSRSREFDADRGAAELLGTGEPLADALGRIEGLAAPQPDGGQPGAGVRVDPQPAGRGAQAKQGVKMAKLFSTHPPTEERIGRLQAM